MGFVDLFVCLLACLLLNFVLQPTCHHNWFSIDVGHLDCNHQFAKGVCALVTLARLLIYIQTRVCTIIYYACFGTNRLCDESFARGGTDRTLFVFFFFFFMKSSLYRAVVVGTSNKTIRKVPKCRQKKRRRT